MLNCSSVCVFYMKISSSAGKLFENLILVRIDLDGRVFFSIFRTAPGKFITSRDRDITGVLTTMAEVDDPNKHSTSPNEYFNPLQDET